MKSSNGGPWSIVTRITLPPFEPYNAPFSSTSAADAVVVVDRVDVAANAICGNGVTSFADLFDVAGAAVVVASVNEAAAAAAATEAFEDDDDLIPFNLGQLNFNPQFGRFTLLSLFVGSLENGHLLQHFVE